MTTNPHSSKNIGTEKMLTKYLQQEQQQKKSKETVTKEFAEYIENLHKSTVIIFYFTVLGTIFTMF